MTQIDDINAAILALQTVAAGTPSGTISWQCEDLAKRLARYVKTVDVPEEELKSNTKKSRK